MSEYDQRQYKLLKSRIVQFREGEIGLPRLISDLDALLCALQSPDEAWKSSFQKSWGLLEEVFATALDRGKQELGPEDRKLVDQAVDQMSKLLEAVCVQSD